MDDYLTKPLSLEALADVVARWAGNPANATELLGSLAEIDRPHESTRTVLDLEIVGRLERLGEHVGEDLMGQLAVLFLADADQRVTALRDALVGDDAAAVVLAAHTLSGASANLGAIDLAHLCSALETDANAGDLLGGGALLDAIGVELGLVRTALEARS
jgi:two-component system sensor histidine kinase/response regulator